MKKEEVEKRAKIKIWAIIVAAFYLPVLLVGEIITANLIGHNTDFFFFIICSIIGFSAFMIICAIEIKVENTDSDKTLIGKTLRAISLIMVYSFFPLLIISGFAVGFWIENANTNQDVTLKEFYAIWFVFVILTVLLFIITSEKHSEKLMADSFACRFGDYDEWKYAFLKKASAEGYAVLPEDTIQTYQITICIREQILLSPLDCLVIIRMSKLYDGFIAPESDTISNYLRKNNHIHNKMITSLNITYIYCVDYSSTTFYDLVNRNMQQDVQNGKLVAGISFDEKVIYVARQKGGIAPNKYNYLRRQLLDIASICEQDALKQ